MGGACETLISSQLLKLDNFGKFSIEMLMLD